MENKLVFENSPYLLQHTNNPVNWYPWSEEALQLARQENKPIFLSIGYAACHWCHVMAHESFENAETASIMNRYFVNIKVDREERPDLDSIYMDAVMAITGSGGWPMSVFLTPDGKPFYGGTYFPPVRRYNRPSFREILETINKLWNEDQETLLNSSVEITKHLFKNQKFNIQQEELAPEALDLAAQNLFQAYDRKHGGWGNAPKFPQPMAIEFLLQKSVHRDAQALETAIHALREMARGGMYDVLGGGFSRYSTDDFWRVPHFEKMLYDNAQLAKTYLYAHLLSGDRFLRQICEHTLDFLVREMMNPAGGFYSSLDADSEGEEGKFYLWTQQEIRSTLTACQAVEKDHDLDWADLFFYAYDVNENGNFEGRTVLQRARDDQALMVKYKLTEEQVSRLLQMLHSCLLDERNKRIRPQADDKVVVAWNGLALIVFSEASRYLKRTDYLKIARNNADFLLTKLNSSGRLLRTWREGKAQNDGFLEDHAALILGLLSLYQSDPDIRWYKAAVLLANDLMTHFKDPEGGFFDTREGQENLLFRPKDLQDNATPSGNALAAIAFMQLASLEGSNDWRDQAEAMLKKMQGLATRYPTGFAKWLCAIDYALNPGQEIALLGASSHPSMQAFLEVIWSQFKPNLLACQSPYPPDPTAPPLLQERPLINGLPTAYLCRNFTCERPVNKPEELKKQIEAEPGKS